VSPRARGFQPIRLRSSGIRKKRRWRAASLESVTLYGYAPAPCVGMAVVTVVAAGACAGSASKVTLDKPPSTIGENPPTTETTISPLRARSDHAAVYHSIHDGRAGPFHNETDERTGDGGNRQRRRRRRFAPRPCRRRSRPRRRARSRRRLERRTRSDGLQRRCASAVAGLCEIPFLRRVRDRPRDRVQLLTSTGDRWADVTLAPAALAQVKSLINTLIPGGSRLSTKHTDGSSFGGDGRRETSMRRRGTTASPIS